ncbi:hypothetical protein [Legionella quateirensis]|uniref:Coiled-coil-containing protein n=1 Tax=Legionella quateirensis TaxID=45072 RepID=A0A378KW70_9GAMM|nr:hypothetical protein [Legionella quateirensis]KTD50997.1 coiled-coil-containing protein [Legionella quateirensis]STY17757.1 coiled-coil-containing protein [Legionella quateirensis]
MSKLNDKKFNEKLSELRNVISDINREGLQVSAVNAEKLLKLTTRYSALSLYFDRYELTQVQRRELREARKSYPKAERSPLKRNIRDRMQEKDVADQKVKVEIAARENKEAEARETVKSFFPSVRLAAEKVLQANTTTIEPLLESYRLLAAELRKAIDLLPKTERAEQTRTLSSIAEQVNVHKEKIDEQDRQVRSQIEQAIKKARETVSGMTVQDMVVSLIGGASKQELSSLLESTRMQAITGGTGAGTLVVADMPIKAQSELVRVLMSELAKTKTSKTGPLGQIIKAMEKDVNALMSGEKTHLSILYDNGKGNVGSVHIDIRDFIRSPQSTLNSLFFHLYKQGVSGDSGLVMSVTSPAEVGALLQLQGFEMQSVPAIENLEALTALVIQNANNPQALSRIMNRTVTENALSASLSQTLQAAKGRPGFNPQEVISFIGSMAVMLEAGKLLVTTPSKQQQRELGLTGLTNTIQGSIQYVQISSPQTAAVTTSIVPMIAPSKPDNVVVSIPPVLSEKKQPAEPKIDLSKEHAQFNTLLDDLKAIHAKLDKKFKSGNTKYEIAAKLADLTHTNIKHFGEQFFANPNKETLKTLNQMTNYFVKQLDPVLKEHRGNSFVHALVAALKGIMGVVAALTVIPALVVEATTKKGYTGTFFSTPETASAKAFKPVEEGLLQQEDEIEKKMQGPK